MRTRAALVLLIAFLLTSIGLGQTVNPTGITRAVGDKMYSTALTAQPGPLTGIGWGDSLTAQIAAGGGDYNKPTVLQRMVTVAAAKAGVHLINDGGVSGETIAQILLRAKTDIVPYKPNIIILLAGTNDMQGTTTLAAMKLGYQALLAEALRQSSFVVVCTLPPNDLHDDRLTVLSQFNTWLKTLPGIYKRVGLADIWPLLANPATGHYISSPNLYTDDGIHPNYRGVNAAHPAIYNALINAGATGGRDLLGPSDPLNLLTDAEFALTPATVATGNVTGSCPNGWGQVNVTGSPMMVCSIEAAPFNRPGNVFWQRKSNSTGRVDFARTYTSTSLTTLLANVAPGDRVLFGVRTYARNSFNTGLGYYIQVRFDSTQVNVANIWLQDLPDGALLMRELTWQSCSTFQVRTITQEFSGGYPTSSGELGIGEITLLNLSRMPGGVTATQYAKGLTNGRFVTSVSAQIPAVRGMSVAFTGSTGSQTLTLPSALSMAGQTLVISNESSVTLSVVGQNSEFTLGMQLAGVVGRYYSTGTAWTTG